MIRVRMFVRKKDKLQVNAPETIVLAPHKLIMFWKILKQREGFTLLELIIVFSVIAIVSTVGVASFVNYNKAQSLNTSYLDLVNSLNTARSYSVSQIKVGGV